MMFFNRIKNIFLHIKNGFTLKHCVISIIMAWCFISIIQTVYISVKYGCTIDMLGFTGKVNYCAEIVLIIAAAIVIYGLNNILNMPVVQKVSLIIITFIYAIMTVVQSKDTYFCLAMAGLMVFSVAYCFDGVNTQLFKLNIRLYRLIMVIGVVLYIGFIGISLVLKYLTYSSPNFDLGLFSQMFYSMSKNLSMNTTSERDVLLSHMCVHISPVFYTLLPFYMIYKSAATLQLLQAVVTAVAVVPLEKICRFHKMSRLETLLICMAYLLYPVVAGGCFYDIHENIFLPVCIFTMIYYCEKESMMGMIISTCFLLGVKEDAAIYAVCIGLYMMFYKKMYKKSMIIIGISAIYFVFTTVLLSKIGDGVMSYRFNNMIYDGSGSMIGIIRSVITNPVYIFTQIMQQDKLEFIIQTLAPLCFMPLFSKRWYRWILFIPYVLFNLMSDYQYFHEIYFQYAFGSGALLVYISVVNISEMDMKIRSRIIPMLTVSGALFFGALIYNRAICYYDYYSDSYEREIYNTFDEAVQTIPDNASVTATTFLCPALSKRDVLYEKYYTDKESQTEYIILDLRLGTTEYNVNDYLNSDKYETVFYTPYRVAVFKNINANV